MCVVIPFIVNIRLVDVPAVLVTTGRMSHRISPPSFRGACLNFIARRIQPSLSLVDREVDFLFTHKLIVLLLLGMIFFFFFFVRKNSSSCDCANIRTHIPTSEGFEIIN